MSDAAPTSDALGAVARAVAERCATGRTVASAESCTGGLVGHLLTDVPGSSAWYPGGVIAYANETKRDVLGVPAELIERHGAVSAQVAIAMADGIRRLLGADLGVAVTGIAGPTGGTAAKPVGLTYVAVADGAGHDVRRHLWQGDRSANKRLSAAAALDLLCERLGDG